MAERERSHRTGGYDHDSKSCVRPSEEQRHTRVGKVLTLPAKRRLPPGDNSGYGHGVLEAIAF